MPSILPDIQVGPLGGTMLWAFIALLIVGGLFATGLGSFVIWAVFWVIVLVVVYLFFRRFVRRASGGGGPI